MSLGKKPGKGSGKKGDEPRRIRFELEADAEELFLKHLEEFKPDKAEAEEVKDLAKRTGKSPRAQAYQELDLHGLTLAEARNRVSEVLYGLRDSVGMHRLKIITGKGHHSQNGDSILAKEIHSYVLATFRQSIVEIEASPDQVRLSGIPLRGHFHLTILGKRSGSPR